MARSRWVYDPHSGGVKIPTQLREEISKQVDDFAQNCLWHPQYQLKLRFRGQFCYIDYMDTEDDECFIFHLCRLRHFRANNWSFALFTYSNEQYEPCFFSDGQMEGTVEAALEISEQFIN